MGYYGTAGDFYRGARGDFYRGGDPGLFDFLGGLAKRVIPIAAPIIGGALGGPIGAAAGGFLGGAFGGVMSGGEGAVGATAPGTSSLPVLVNPMASLARRAAPGIAGTIAVPALRAGAKMLRRAGRKLHILPVGARRHRRVNPLNPRALRRSLRRIKGFEHFAKSVVRISSPKKHVSGFKFPRRKRRHA